MNRSTTLYWENEQDSPDNIEGLIFNVSMSARIQTGYTDTILHSACTNGQLDIVRFYVDKSRYLNEQNGYLNTALHCATLRGHLEVISLLLKKDPELDLQNVEGETVLHLAITNDLLDAAMMYLDKGCDIGKQNKYGDTPLHVAVGKKMTNIIKMLIDKGADMAIKNNHGNTPLHSCINYVADADTVRLLLQSSSGYDEDLSESQTRVIDLQNTNGDTMLHCAAKHCNPDIVRMILKYTKTRAQNVKGDTPLHCAVKLPNLETVKILIEEVKDLLKVENNFGNTPLHCAAERGDDDVVEYLIHVGAEVNTQNKIGDSALHCGIKNGKYETVRMLLAGNAGVLKHNSNGDSIIHCLVTSNAPDSEKIDVLKLLVSFKADINSQDGDCNTPLHLAIKTEKKRLAQMLISYKEIVYSIKDNNGDTVLHLIAANNYLDIIENIQATPDDLNAVNNDGDTALNVALNLGYGDVSMVFLKLSWNLEL